jgi:hypothetical protein
MEGSGTHGRWNQPLAVPSAEHPRAWEQITPQISRVKGEYSDWWSEPLNVQDEINMLRHNILIALSNTN